MVPIIITDNEQHTLTWLVYQVIVKINMEFGYTVNVLLFDLVRFLSIPRNRHFIDIILLTWLFYYLWKGKIDIGSNEKKGFKKSTFVGSLSIAWLLITLKLDMVLWSIIFIFMFIFTLLNISIHILNLMQNVFIRYGLMLWLMYVSFKWGVL